MIVRVWQRHPEVVVVLAGVSAALHVGKLSPAIPVLRDALGVSLLQAGFLLSLVQFAGMLFGLVAGLLADSMGLKRSMLVGLTVLSIAGALGALAEQPGHLLALRACEGFGFLLTVMPGPALIRRLTPAAHMQSALGMWGAYMPLGTALALAGGPMVIGLADWRGWWLLMAGLTMVMAVWVALAIGPDVPAAPVAPKARRKARTVQVTWTLRVRRTLSARGPWLVALCFALYSGQWLAVIGFLPSVVAQSGRFGSAAATLLALAALVNVVGNVASGRLLQRGVAARHLLGAGFTAMALGAVIAFADIGWSGSPQLTAMLRYGGVLLFSMVGGLIPGTLFSLAVRLAPDEASVSTTVGWMQQLSALGQFLGPPLVAWVAAAAGGWHWTWVATGSCCLLGLVVAQRIHRQLMHART
ncbi:MAG: MFS transporter [Burkholderiaceae bacterium]|nr:MFS transporter [Rhodoferax sp.]MCB2040735.1 MFS transporter [Rhodoferax sp.]MCW5629404.1 MFS transporter [Rhodoferax sp.]